MVVDSESLRLLLSHKRAQIQPEDVGLPARQPGGRGRPIPGISQEQVDELLGHRAWGTYARFERGQLKGLSLELCRDVARVLRFNELDWQGMWVYLTGHQPPEPLDRLAAQRVGAHWQKYLSRVGWPAAVADQGWNVIVHNEAYAQVFPGGVAPRNNIRWMLLDPAGRRALVNWEQDWAPFVLPQLKAAVAAYPDNETLQELDRDVRADPVTGPRYAQIRDAYLQPDGDVRLMWHSGLHRTAWVQVVSATPQGSPGARLVALMFDE